MRTPPEALTPISGPTVSRISCTSSTVAPPPPKPVEVFTKSAPAAFGSEQPMIFSSRVSSAVSRITLTTVSRADRLHDAADVLLDQRVVLAT